MIQIDDSAGEVIYGEDLSEHELFALEAYAKSIAVENPERSEVILKRVQQIRCDRQ